MASGPCADCFSGALATGTPAGTATTIHGLQTYVSQPEAGTLPKGLVVMIPDAFGWEMPNNRLLCDMYAKKGGYLVYLPDFMNGSSMPSACLAIMDQLTKPSSWLTTIFYKPLYAFRALYMALPWLVRTRSSVCKPRIVSFFQALRTSPPPFDTNDLKISASGFCWGGQHTVFLCQDAPSTRVVRHVSQISASEGRIERLVDCAFTAHPSFLNVPEDIEKVSVPLSVAIGDEDMALAKDKIQVMREILEVKKKGDHECVILPGAKHGFGVRSQADDKEQLVNAAKSEEQALNWFSRWLG